MLAALALGMSAAGCFPTATCDLILEEPPVITVTSSATGDSICDATIVASRPGAADLTLVSFVPPAEAGGPGCQYFPASLGADGGVNGASNFPDGTYTLQVSKQGFKSRTVPNVVSQSFSCDQQATPAQQVKIALDPA